MDSPLETKEAVALDIALEAVAVRDPGDHPGPADWWGVEIADQGVIAYHSTRRAALRHRLWLINDMVNPHE